MSKTKIKYIFLSLFVVLLSTPALSSVQIVKMLNLKDIIFESDAGVVMLDVSYGGQCTSKEKGIEFYDTHQGKTFMCDGAQWILPETIAVQ